MHSIPFLQFLSYTHKKSDTAYDYTINLSILKPLKFYNYIFTHHSQCLPFLITVFHWLFPTFFLYFEQSINIGFGCQKVYSITFIVRFHKRNMESFSLCNGDKTHESWKPLLNTLFAFRGSSECFAQWNLQYFFVQSDIINLNADLLTPES